MHLLFHGLLILHYSSRLFYGHLSAQTNVLPIPPGCSIIYVYNCSFNVRSYNKCTDQRTGHYSNKYERELFMSFHGIISCLRY